MIRIITKSIVAPLMVAALVMIFMAPVVLAAPGAPGSVVNKQLAAARQATVKYHDVSRALADGYVPISPHIPNMGAHYLRFVGPVPAVDPFFAVTEPEMLLYSWAEGDGPKLVGLEYVLVALGPAPEGFAGDSDEWHFHEAACHYADGVEIPWPDPDTCPDRGVPLAIWHPPLWLLHAWIWRGNPDGIFAELNPNVP